MVSIRRMDNLPLDLTTFVGRRSEMEAIRRLLSTSRLLTLTGLGGVGKTRLAVEVSRRLRRAYSDGVWFVALGDVYDSDLVAVAVMDSIGLHTPAKEARDALIDYLRNKQILLVLDNCEHLIGASAELAAALLGACAKLRVLATSREPLRISGEQLYPVPPLSVPSQDQPLSAGDSVRFESVALFAQRASAVVPDFSVTATNRDAVVTLCRQLDGLPLAIELAAVRLRALALNELMAGRHGRYGLLTLGSRTASPRHQTLRATVDWSYGLCTPREQILWARLSVFSGNFDITDAEDVCSDDAVAGEDFFAAITGLVDKSILILDEQNGPARYRLLETIREYGRERLLDRGEEREFLARHRDHYLRLAERVRREWFGPGQLELFAKLRAVQANIRAVLEYCLATSEKRGTGLRIAASLCRFGSRQASSARVGIG